MHIANDVTLTVWLQFQVVAYDSEDPVRRITADVTVFITRNPSGPAFLQDPYERVIGENFPLGDTVLNTTAVDLDGVRDMDGIRDLGGVRDQDGVRDRDGVRDLDGIRDQDGVRETGMG